MDTARKWKAELDESESQWSGLSRRVDGFNTELARQKAEDAEILRTISNKREYALREAFKRLETMTIDLLGVQDPEEPLGTDHVPSLSAAVKDFHQLSKICEEGLDRVGQEFVDTTQTGGENRKTKEDIDAFVGIVQGQARGSYSAWETAWHNKNDCQHSVDSATHELHKAREKQSGFVYDLFGDRDIDDAVRNNDANVFRVEGLLRESTQVWSDIGHVREQFEYLLNESKPMAVRLQELFEANGSEYASLVDGRRRDERCWSSVRALEYHVSTLGPDTSRDSALRHVVQLIRTTEEVVDTDDIVRAAKTRIEAEIRNKLGVEAAKALFESRAYLPGAEGDF